MNMKNIVIITLLPLIFSCGGSLEKETSAKKGMTNEKVKEETEEETVEEKDTKKENSLETEVTRVMQEYGYTGLGTYISPSGDKWVGEWKDGKMNGQGTCTYSDGKKYVGEWKNNQWNGQGTLHIWEGYEYYVGGFKDGRFHGKGVYTKPSDGGPIVDKGTWVNGIWTIRE
jgi:hypothetical protein